MTLGYATFSLLSNILILWNSRGQVFVPYEISELVAYIIGSALMIGASWATLRGSSLGASILEFGFLFLAVSSAWVFGMTFLDLGIDAIVYAYPLLIWTTIGTTGVIVLRQPRVKCFLGDEGIRRDI